MTVTPLILASPATLSELVSRLPSEARVQVAWAPQHIADVAKGLLATPLVTEPAIEAAADSLSETSRALSAATVELTATEQSALIENGLEHHLKRLPSLGPVSASAAVRAIATTLLATHLEAPPPLLHAAALLTAVFEGLRRGSPVPGRVESLARRADVVAAAFAAPMRLPWYFESAPGSALVESFAAWNLANQPRLRPLRQPTPEDLEWWERVKADIDSTRPHRRLFA